MNIPLPFGDEVKTASPLASFKCPNMIVVASGKGGVGKTMISSSLCQAMAKKGKNVLLFDGDIGLANIDIQLGLTPNKDIAHMLNDGLDIKDAVTHYEEGNFDIVAGRSGSGSLATLPFVKITQLRNSLLSIASSYDHIIVDLGAGVDKAVRHLAGPAATTYVVITDEPTSLTDGYAFIKLTRAADPESDVRIIVNMAKGHQDGNKIYETIATACRRFINYAPPLAGIIRRDPKVRESIRMQTPVLTRHPSCDAAQDIRALAKNILGS